MASSAPSNSRSGHGADGDPELVVLGHLNGAYGVRGWVKVHSDSRPLENILSYQRWYLQLRDGWQPRRVLDGHPQGKGLVARIEGCEDRDLAASLRGTQIAVEAGQLPQLEADEYYWRDLVGLDVVTTEGQALGRVDHLLETGNNDVLVVKGDRERLIPYLPGRVVREIDLGNRRLIADWDPEF